MSFALKEAIALGGLTVAIWLIHGAAVNQDVAALVTAIPIAFAAGFIIAWQHFAR
jgi:hypothetical protein